jgi:amino acid transporter
MVWTAAIALPFAPFSNLLPIIVAGGPGIWFVLAYVLFIVVGVGGFGALSAFLTTVELHERRTIDPRTMWPAIILLSIGVVGSCFLLGAAGAVGGYAATYGASSAGSIDSLLSPYVYPISSFTLVTIVGAALAVLSMVRARWPPP